MPYNQSLTNVITKRFTRDSDMLECLLSLIERGYTVKDVILTQREIIFVI